MKKYGTVLVFKEGVTKAEAQLRLAALKDIVEPGGHFDFDKRAFVRTDLPTINEFNSAHGGPVWYIP